ncbi:MAG: class I SAM-dependent methyltransferase [Burkholderiaceae bacterium]
MNPKQIPESPADGHATTRRARPFGRLDRRSVMQLALAASLSLGAVAAQAQNKPAEAFTPQVGQAGKDVIWVPTPDALVNRMLKMAQVTPEDVVVDLGSGDGKIVIAAARDFKARSLGVEFNPDMVTLSRRNAQAAGVAERARFEQGDIFTYDYSNATVVTMYLLPGLNLKLRPTLLKMKPGTRLVTHQFTMGSWEPDDTTTVENRPGYLWIVPAAVGGSWQMTGQETRGTHQSQLSLTQAFQQVTGTWRGTSMDGKLRSVRISGDLLSFDMMDPNGVLRSYVGRVNGARIEGTTLAADGTAGTFVATRVGPAMPVDGGRE